MSTNGETLRKFCILLLCKPSQTEDTERSQPSFARGSEGETEPTKCCRNFRVLVLEKFEARLKGGYDVATIAVVVTFLVTVRFLARVVRRTLLLS